MLFVPEESFRFGMCDRGLLPGRYYPSPCSFHPVLQPLSENIRSIAPSCAGNHCFLPPDAFAEGVYRKVRVNRRGAKVFPPTIPECPSSPTHSINSSLHELYEHLSTTSPPTFYDQHRSHASSDCLLRLYSGGDRGTNRCFRMSCNRGTQYTGDERNTAERQTGRLHDRPFSE